MSHAQTLRLAMWPTRSPKKTETQEPVDLACVFLFGILFWLLSLYFGLADEPLKDEMQSWSNQIVFQRVQLTVELARERDHGAK